MKRGDLFRVRHPGRGDRKRSRVFVVVSRQARFYTITNAGRRQLRLEEESWERLCSGVRRVLGYA